MARSAQKARGKKLARVKSAHAKSDSMDITSVVGDTSIPVIAFRQLLENCMEEYGKYVVENRAIPCIHDGMKPVHRRVLWGAYAMGAKSSGKTIKTARVVGEVMGKYHPHGDAAISDTISGMIEGTACPLLHAQGNFGSYTKTAPAAAMRYTECKLSQFTEQYLLDPYYLNVTPMVPNYDSSEQEPVTLPAMLPMALLTNAYGIALATTTNIPSYSIESLKKVVLAMLKGKDDPKAFSKMLELASGYGGYPTSSEKEKYYLFTKTGARQINWKNEYSIISEDTMEITGMHPEWNFDTKMAAISKFDFVQSANDITSQDGIRIRITVKKNTSDSDWEKLKRMMEGTITYRCNVIRRKYINEDGFPEVLGKFESTNPYAIIKSWLKWRLNLEQRALKFEMNALKDRMARENLLLLACQQRDVIFKILKLKKVDKVALLAKELDITLEDSKYIWGIAVGRLDTLSEEEQNRKLADLKARGKQIRIDFANPAVPVYQKLSAA